MFLVREKRLETEARGACRGAKVVLGSIVGIAMTILGVLLIPQILIWMDTPSAVMKDAVVYLRLLFSGSLFLAITIPITQSIEMLYWVYPLTWGLSSLAFFIYYRVSNLFEYEQTVN